MSFSRVCAVAASVCASVHLVAWVPAQSPSPDGRALAAFVTAHNAEALTLLERVVNINSGTQNFAGVREVGRIFRAEFDALGFKTEWVAQDAVKRGGHLVADHPGSGPRLLLIGHLDTVFETDSPFQKFQRLDAKTATGPGVIDMKGGDVIIVHALRALQSIGALKTMNVVVVMTGDEEDGGRPLTVARAALVAAAKGADVAIGFEDGDGDPSHAVVARRSSTNWQLDVTGTPAHSSQIFSEPVGAGAIFETARILNAFREKLAGEAHLTFNPGAITGGTSADLDPVQTRGAAFGKTNVVAAHTHVIGDLRALSPEQVTRAEETMKTVVAESLPRTKATIVFGEGYPPLAPTDANSQLLALYSHASEDMGLGAVTAVNPDKAGAADVSFVAGQAKAIIDAVGLKGHDDHTPGETADLSSLPMQTTRAAVVLLRLSKGAIR